jgi:citronellol/citronellal dehydrogenase
MGPRDSQIFAPGVLEGQTVLITGGGTGLGKAAARELVACGASVVIAGRRGEVLTAACEDIGGERVSWVSGDVRHEADAGRLIDSVLERHGALDVLLNNAGGQYFVPAEAIPAKGWRAVTRLNVGGTMKMTQAAVERAMRPAGHGVVLNVTLSPHHGLAGMTHSSAARAAVEGLTREWAEQWAGDGISVVALAAGHFETEALDKYPDVVRQGAARSVPLQRLGRPEEHAWLVALLCTPLARALSGSTVTLDGARDNWAGPWPPTGLADDGGEVPTEERKRRGAER